LNDADLLTGIIRTLGLTALVLLFYSMVIRRFPDGKRKGAAVGFLLAAAGILSMHDPISVAPGVFYDGRTALLAVAFTYGGALGVVVAASAMACYRIWLGGIGMVPGILSILIVSFVGFAFTFIPLRSLTNGVARSILLGLAASISLFTVLLLPENVRVQLLGFPIFAIVLGNIANVVIITTLLEREKARVRLMRALEHEAWVDPLTQLQNRRAFDRAALLAMNDSAARDTACSLIMIDIDHFKSINDRLGHDKGDRVLAMVAAIIRKNVRATDVVVRYGGEEIALLLANTRQPTAQALAERIRKEIESAEFGISGEPIAVTVSAGVASLDDRHPSIDALLRAADKALYSAKALGRNRVEGT
jgi:diguanylate cyclase